MSLLAASVVLALVPATEAFAPVPWFVGTLLVLLSRRWSAADKALAVGAFGVLGVPFVLLGRDELPTSMSLVVSVLLVGRLAGRRDPPAGRAGPHAARAGQRPADALTARHGVPNA